MNRRAFMQAFAVLVGSPALPALPAVRARDEWRQAAAGVDLWGTSVISNRQYVTAQYLNNLWAKRIFDAVNTKP